MAKKQQRKNKNQQAHGDNSSDCCLWDGCLFIDLADGCFILGDNDGCIDLPFGDGCIDLDFDGCSMALIMLPFRLAVIIGLMIYGDWDYQNWRAKEQKF